MSFGIFRRAGGALLLGCLPVLAGCGNLATTAFAPESMPPNAGKPLAGVPFTMNRLVFNVTRSPGADSKPDSFTVAATTAPDPHRRYQLQIDPDWLATSDWTMSYDDGGSFSSTTAKVADQSVAILTSIGKLVSTVALFAPLLGADASATHFDDSKLCVDIPPGIRAQLASDPDNTKDGLDGIDTDNWPADKKDAWAALLKRYKADGDNFVYADDNDKALLQFALSKAESLHRVASCIAPLPPADPLSGDAAAEFSALQARIIDALNLAAADGTVDQVRANNDALKKLVDDTQKKYLAEFATLKKKYDGLIDPDFVPISEGKSHYPDSVVARLKLINAVLAITSDVLAYRLVYDRQPVPDAKAPPPTTPPAPKVKENGFHPAVILLMNILAADDATRNGLRLAALTKQITHCQQITANPDAKICGNAGDESLKNLMRRRADFLGLAKEYDNRQSLQAQLLDESNPKNIKILSDQIAALDKLLSDALTAASQAATAAKADDAPVQARLFVLPANTPEAEDADDVIAQFSDDAIVKLTHPDYVVVMQPQAYVPAVPAVPGDAKNPTEP